MIKEVDAQKPCKNCTISLDNSKMEIHRNLTFVYSGIWNLSTVLIKNQLTAVNLLTVYPNMELLWQKKVPEKAIPAYN